MYDMFSFKFLKPVLVEKLANIDYFCVLVCKHHLKKLRHSCLGHSIVLAFLLLLSLDGLWFLLAERSEASL